MRKRDELTETTFTADDQMPDLITESWLRECGWKYEQCERQSSKHWLLWLGGACVENTNAPDWRRGRTNDSDSLGIELAQVQPGIDLDWYCWLRSDVAGRYSRLLHVRHLAYQHHVVRLIEALTGTPWEPANVFYGALRSTEYADYLRRDAERLDVRLAHEWGARAERELKADPAKREIIRP